jgi:hypothetical protein
MVQEVVGLERVCINLFPQKWHAMKSVRRIIKQSDDSEIPPLLIIVTNTTSGELSRFKKRQEFDASDSGRQLNIDGLNRGTIRYQCRATRSRASRSTQVNVILPYYLRNGGSGGFGTNRGHTDSDLCDRERIPAIEDDSKSILATRIEPSPTSRV